jgi:hypothetical protein
MIYKLTTDIYFPVGIDDSGKVLIGTTSNCNAHSSQRFTRNGPARRRNERYFGNDRRVRS